MFSDFSLWLCNHDLFVLFDFSFSKHNFTVISIRSVYIAILSFNIKLGRKFLVNQFQLMKAGLPVSTYESWFTSFNLWKLVYQFQLVASSWFAYREFELVNRNTTAKTGKPESCLQLFIWKHSISIQSYTVFLFFLSYFNYLIFIS